MFSCYQIACKIYNYYAAFIFPAIENVWYLLIQSKSPAGQQQTNFSKKRLN